jgi:hypothetical protein
VLSLVKLFVRYRCCEEFCRTIDQYIYIRGDNWNMDLHTTPSYQSYALPPPHTYTVHLSFLSHYFRRHGPSVTEFFWSFRLRCACYTCNYAYSAIPRVRKILKKLLRIEIENYHIIMTMGIHSIEPPWLPIWLIQTYKTKYRHWCA